MAGTASVQDDKPKIEPEGTDLVGAKKFEFTRRREGERDHARTGILVRKENVGCQMKHRWFAPQGIHQIGPGSRFPLEQNRFVSLGPPDSRAALDLPAAAYQSRQFHGPHRHYGSGLPALQSQIRPIVNRVADTDHRSIQIPARGRKDGRNSGNNLKGVTFHHIEWSVAGRMDRLNEGGKGHFKQGPIGRQNPCGLVSQDLAGSENLGVKAIPEADSLRRVLAHCLDQTRDILRKPGSRRQPVELESFACDHPEAGFVGAEMKTQVSFRGAKGLSRTFQKAAVDRVRSSLIARQVQRGAGFQFFHL